ncbi:ribonuclease H2 subunit A [Eurytemora carolleeae]|uniref:ribonuclease H2 subunit A n=1 Tax=Eurytemora carolleeae TaxID=1294199 RepID=UPI000C78A4ED|nr:ribonuclease H2 subunit A [Eurytemora carolleeae]|eukprot:XP_023338163.1 ribonuclease H2 subunit A-like [Eurytemora affinis]
MVKITIKKADIAENKEEEGEEEDEEVEDEEEESVDEENQDEETGSGSEEDETAKKFSCTHCDYSTDAEENLKTHEELAHRDGRYYCKECDFSCKRREVLRKHQETHTKLEKSSRSSSKTSKSGSPIPPTVRPTRKQLYTCDLCHKAFHSRFVIKTHLKAHDKFEESDGNCDKYYLYYYYSICISEKKMDISEYVENNSNNLQLFSEIPEICTTEPCVLGVDEAGRGPVLGPMALTEAQRDQLLEKVLVNNSYIGWAITMLSPKYISTSMYRRGKYNLNTMSHDTAISLIQAAIDKGVKVSEVYVDTVGPPEKYQAKLEGIFPGIKMTVAKKADSLYPCVSAASICAKVARDRALSEWKFTEGSDLKGPWGSGYPGDPVTKKFLQESFHPVFGFPGLVRFSWKTAEKIIDEKGVKVEWEEVEPEEDDATLRNPSVSQYFVKVGKPTKGKPSRIHPYFKERCLAPLTTL